MLPVDQGGGAWEWGLCAGAVRCGPAEFGCLYFHLDIVESEGMLNAKVLI